MLDRDQDFQQRHRGRNPSQLSVSGNWRITFEFSDGNAQSVNYEDYHSSGATVHSK